MSKLDVKEPIVSIRQAAPQEKVSYLEKARMFRRNRVLVPSSWSFVSFPGLSEDPSPEVLTVLPFGRDSAGAGVGLSHSGTAIFL